MAENLRDFLDLQNAVMAQLKYQSTDTVSRTRIKSDINMIYDQVLAFKKWYWAKDYTSVRIEPYYSTGTVSATQDSATITFSTGPAESKTNHYIQIGGYNEVYKIAAHTAAATTATLEVAYTGDTTSGAAMKIWNPIINLPTDCREVACVWNDWLDKPMQPLGPEKLREFMASTKWTVQSRPRYYSVLDYFEPASPEVEATRYRQLMVHPAILNRATTIKIDYIKEVVSLDSDTDEPIMPIEDRMVLFYGACAHSWHRERDPEAAARYDGLYQQRLAQMAGKMQDSQDSMKLHGSELYLNKKRNSQGRFFLPMADVLSNGSNEMVTWTQVNLNDNQAVAQVILTENKKALFIKYAIRRGTSTAETGEMFIAAPTDLSAVAYSPFTVEVGDTGVTLIGAVSGVNLQLQYTSSSTGSAATMWYYLIGPS